MTAAEALSAWLEHLAHERRLSPRTLEAYGHIGRLYLAFLERHRGEPQRLADLGSVTAAELRAHLAERRSGDHPLNARSLSQTLSAIRTFHGFLDRRCDTPAPQLALVRGPRVKASLPRPISADQARGLLAEPALDPDAEPWEAARDAAVLSLLYGCGLRISEALSLTRAEAPLPETLRITGKGGKTRLVPVLPAVRAAVDAAVAAQPFPLAPADALFRARRGGGRGAPPRPGPGAPPPRPGCRAEAAWTPRSARQRHAPCAEAQFRHPSAGGGGRPARDPGTAGPRQPVDDPEIHRR
jgi:integrase/recombinase XerC